MSKNERVYEVTIKSTQGTAEKEIFKKMLSRGDVVSDKIKDIVGAVVTITGIASANIHTREKDFMQYYFICNEGIFSTGSEIFYESVTDYFGEVNTVKIVEVRTKNGITYKAMPIIAEMEMAVIND